MKFSLVLPVLVLAIAPSAFAQQRGGGFGGGVNNNNGRNGQGATLPLPKGVDRVISIDALNTLLVQTHDDDGNVNYTPLVVKHLYSGGVAALFGGTSIPTAQFVSPGLTGLGNNGGGNGFGGNGGGFGGNSGFGGNNGGFGGNSGFGGNNSGFGGNTGGFGGFGGNTGSNFGTTGGFGGFGGFGTQTTTFEVTPPSNSNTGSGNSGTGNGNVTTKRFNTPAPSANGSSSAR